MVRPIIIAGGIGKRLWPMSSEYSKTVHEG